MENAQKSQQKLACHDKISNIIKGDALMTTSRVRPISQLTRDL